MAELAFKEPTKVKASIDSNDHTIPASSRSHSGFYTLPAYLPPGGRGGGGGGGGGGGAACS